MLQLAVCSRVDEYQDLGVKLRLQGAVLVQPLTKQEIGGYMFAHRLLMEHFASLYAKQPEDTRLDVE